MFFICGWSLLVYSLYKACILREGEFAYYVRYPLCVTLPIDGVQPARNQVAKHGIPIVIDPRIFIY